MPATQEFQLSIEQRRALVELGSHSPKAMLDPQALAGLVAAGMVKVSENHHAVLTTRGELSYAYMSLSE